MPSAEVISGNDTVDGPRSRLSPKWRAGSGAVLIMEGTKMTHEDAVALAVGLYSIMDTPPTTDEFDLLVTLLLAG